MTGYLSALVRPRFYWLAVLYWAVVYVAALLAAVAGGGLFESQVAASILGAGLAIGMSACLAAWHSAELRGRIARSERAAERLRHRLRRAGAILGLAWLAVIALQIAIARWGQEPQPEEAAPAALLAVVAAALGLGVLAGALRGLAGRGWQADGGEATATLLPVRHRLSAFLRAARVRLAAEAPDVCLVHRGSGGDLHLRASQPPLSFSGSVGAQAFLLLVMADDFYRLGRDDRGTLMTVLGALLVVVLGSQLGSISFEFVRWIRGFRRPNLLVIDGDRIRCDQMRSGTAPEIEVGELTSVVWGTAEEAVFGTRSGSRYYLRLSLLGDEERDVVHEWLAERLPFYRIPGTAGPAAAQATGRAG